MIDSELEQAIQELAIGCRVLASNGQEDKTLGHLSMRDPEGRGFWLKRAGVGLSEIKSTDDFILVDFDGRRIHGEGAKHMEWPIHSEILRQRDDINIVGHTHPFYSSLFAAMDEDLLPYAHEACYFAATVPRYKGTSFLINTPALGRELANALGAESNVVIMNNHGLTFCGHSVAVAISLAIIFEKACCQQITLKSTGCKLLLPNTEDLMLKTTNLPKPAVLNQYWSYYVRMLSAEERGLQNPPPEET